VLDLGEFLLYLGDVVAVGVQELGLVLLDHVLHLFVHVVDGPVEVAVGLEDRLRAVGCYKLGFCLHFNKIILSSAD
jgi:hypothetical protein